MRWNLSTKQWQAIVTELNLGKTKQREFYGPYGSLGKKKYFAKLYLNYFHPQQHKVQLIELNREYPETEQVRMSHHVTYSHDYILRRCLCTTCKAEDDLNGDSTEKNNFSEP